METKNFERERYERAKKQVKRITAFYTHLIVYIVVNLMIVVINVQQLGPDESYFQWRNFTTLGLWGIGLLAHGMSVFLPSIVLGQQWEEKKIQEIMGQERRNKWE